MPMVSVKRNPNYVATAPKPRKGLNYKVLQEVETEEVKWLWYPYIPAGKLSLLEGDPGQGKSWITCALAADISAGRKLPGQREALPPQKVLMLSAEDGLGDTIRPRIEAMQGNLGNIIVSDDFFILDAEGIRDLEDLMRKVSATIVFMDPIVAYMGAKVDMHRANEVRGLMTALAEAGKNTGSAIVAVRHLRKATGGKAIYSGIGSIDFTAAVRSVMQVQETKSGTKFMYHAKHNLTPKGPSLGYRMVENRFEWQGELIEEQEGDKKVSTKALSVARAEIFLFDFLKDGPKYAMDLMEAAAVHGISAPALNRAKKGVPFSKKSADTGHWMWYLEARDGIDAPNANIKSGTIPQEIIDEAKARLELNRGV